MSDIVPTEERKKLYADLKAELYKRQVSNSENFDKSILTYAVASLGFSLGFLKDFIPVTQAVHAWMLYASWALFVLAIVVTVASFVVSQVGIKKQLKLAERYYLEYDDSALRQPNVFARLTDRANITSGVTFVIALVLTTLFVALNLEGAAIMKRDLAKSVQASQPEIVKIPEPDVVRGQPIPDIDPVPAPTPSPTPSPAPVPNSSPPGSRSLVGNRESGAR